MSRQPNWVLIANLGDVSPIDYGGYFVYRDTTGAYPEEAEYLETPEDDAKGQWRVYRFSLDRMAIVIKDGVTFLVPRSIAERPNDLPHPIEQYDEWFHESLPSVASSIGISVEELRRMFISADPLRRAEAYRAVAEYHGWENLDSYPLTYSDRAEVEMRYDNHLAALRDARYLIRDHQKIVHDADTWHQLSRVLNYLDAQIANREESIREDAA